MRFYNQILTKLRNKIPFKFSRWGDGEWGCMFGWQGANRDGNAYLPELREELIRIIESEPKYYIGIQPGVLVDVGRGYDPGMRGYVIDTLFRTNLNTVVGDTLHYASEFGYLGKFIEVLKERDTIIVGAEYFKDTPFRHIVISDRDSFPENKEINLTIALMGTQPSVRNPVFLIAAAMNSNVIIDRLPENVTAIDIGSVLDPYLGIPRAGYQHNMKIEKLW
jgi:hypothetical protein